MLPIRIAMPEKVTISFRVSPVLADRFRQSMTHYYGKVGATMSAAMLMYMEADPVVQGQYLKRVLEAEVDEEVEAAVEAALSEQRSRIKRRRQSKQ